MRQTISEGDRTSEMGQEYCGLHWHQYNLPDGLDPPPERQVDQGPGQQQAARQLPADGPDIVNTLRYVQHEITKICQQTLIWSWGNPDLPKIDLRGKKKNPIWELSNLKHDIDQSITCHLIVMFEDWGTEMRGLDLLEELIRGHLGLAGGVGEVPPHVHRDLSLEDAVPVTRFRAWGKRNKDSRMARMA